MLIILSSGPVISTHMCTEWNLVKESENMQLNSWKVYLNLTFMECETFLQFGKLNFLYLCEI